MFNNLSKAAQMNFIDEHDYNPGNYLIGELREIYTRSLVGHGTETKAISILLSEGVIVEHEVERIGDYSMINQIPEYQSKIEIHENNIHVNISNLVCYPKALKYAAEQPGYFNLRIVLSKDISIMENLEAVAKKKLVDLQTHNTNPHSNG